MLYPLNPFPDPRHRRYIGRMSATKQKIWLPMLLALAILAVFGCGLRFGFLDDWDDAVFVLANPRLELTWDNVRHYACHPFLDLYTPLPMYSLMLDRALFGLSPFGYHLHNLLLHIAAALLLYAVVRRLDCRPAVAFAAALLWAIHPQKAESVLWIAERKDVLCGAFAFLAMWLFLDERPVWCALAAFLAVAAKPAAVPLFGVFAVLAFAWPLKNRRHAILPACAALAAALLSFAVTAQTNPGRVETNLAVPLHNLAWYPLTAVLPIEKSPVYPETVPADLRFWLILLGAVLLAATLVYAARRLGCGWWPILAAAMLLGGTLLPALGLLHYTNFRYCDRYNYLPSAVLLATLALLAERAIQARYRNARPLLVAAAALAAVTAIVAWDYAHYWRDCQTLSYYAMQRPGRPNRKLYDMAINSALKAGNTDYLAYLVRQLRERPPVLEHDAGQIDNLLIFLDAHLALRRGDTALARAHYRRLMERADPATHLLALPDTYIPVARQDLDTLFPR